MDTKIWTNESIIFSMVLQWIAITNSKDQQKHISVIRKYKIDAVEKK